MNHSKHSRAWLCQKKQIPPPGSGAGIRVGMTKKKWEWGVYSTAEAVHSRYLGEG